MFKNVIRGIRARLMCNQSPFAPADSKDHQQMLESQAQQNPIAET